MPIDPMNPTSRQRFLDTLKFKPVRRPWVRWGAFLWDETVERWKQEGWDGTPLDDYFDLDRLVRVDPWYGPVPEFKREVLSEDAETVTYVNHEGIVMREFKQHHDMSMPQFVKFPVETEAEFERFAAERLALNAAQRLSPEWKKMVASGRVQAAVGRGELSEADQVAAQQKPTAQEEWPRKCWADRWGGFFGSLRNMLGVENLCMAFYDQPRLIERMMEERADRIIEITGEVLKHARFDVFWFWEDMAYKGGSLVGPELFRKFAFPHYRRVCDWLHNRGIEHIGLDSDGNITSLIPLWLDAGLDHLWPFEVQAGMDVVQVRKQYGRRLAMMGGLDKRVLRVGGEVMRQEVDRLMPLVEDGGYIPEMDHSVPPDVSWENFCDYIGYLKHRLGRG
jgi:Uroporphyrinogen decarboxylase (URO-D)